MALASMTQPAWVCRVLDHIRAAHRLTLLIRVPEEPPEREPLAARLFHRIDRAIYARSADGLTPCDATSFFDGVPVASEAKDVDVLLAFAPFESDGAEVWTIEHDGLAAFAARKPLMEATIRRSSSEFLGSSGSSGRRASATTRNSEEPEELRGTKVIARTNAPVDAISFRRAMSRLGLRTGAMLEHALAVRASGGTLRLPARPGPSLDARDDRKSASNIQILGRTASFLRRWPERKLRDRFANEHWSIAFSFDAGAIAALDFRRFHHIVPPPDRMWADPFVVGDGDRAWIFLEEMLFSENRGVLAVMEVRRDGTWSQPRRILERPYHLSYPCVFQWNGGWYMVPETGGNRTIDLYRCLEFPHRWELQTTLMMGVHAVDTTLFEANGRWWMLYATDSGDTAGFERLWLQYAENPLGPWTPHPWSPIECDVIGGRPGGRPFLHRGKLVRAGQIGAPRYGHAIQLRELVTLTPDEWQEREVLRITPDWYPGSEGTHTLNADGGVMVIDAFRERWKF